MTDPADWRDAVKVVRGFSPTGRTTVFDFAGSGGEKTWIGSVALPGGVATGRHHHGRHEVAIYVTKGRAEISWGERLEHAAEIGPGDFVYFAPYVPHQERNLETEQPLELVVVRSDNERIAVSLD